MTESRPTWKEKLRKEILDELANTYWIGIEERTIRERMEKAVDVSLKHAEWKIEVLEKEIEEDNKKFAKFFKKLDAPKNKKGIKLIEKAIELGLVAKSEEGFLHEPIEDIDYNNFDTLESWVNEQQKIVLNLDIGKVLKSSPSETEEGK